MDREFLRILEESHDVHSILPIDSTQSNTYRLGKKQVLASRRLSDMTSLAGWEKVTPYVDLSVSEEVKFDGHATLMMVCPSNLPTWSKERMGRIYAEPSALYRIAREDWREWNRLSVNIYPAIHGMKSITLRLQLHNDGVLKSPDRWERTGAHNFALKPFTWNHITLEIPMVPRECVTGVSIDYDMCGHENDSDPMMTWYLADLDLQKVEADKEEGWEPDPKVIAISGSGYRTTSPKFAVASDMGEKRFRVIETRTGREVFSGATAKAELAGETMLVMDFSPISDPGDYILLLGERSGRTIHIGDDVWEPSVWKVLNFFLSQRCGMEVAGKHRACHRDLLLVHGDKSIVANGGWHDAADLAQGMANTADGTGALFLLADALKERRPRLYRRVLEEACWGLDYVLKVRFGDGWRSSYSSTSIWTDGVIGTNDDVVSRAVQSPYMNLVSAFAEAAGAYTLREEDPALSAQALAIACDDFAWAEDQLRRAENGEAGIDLETNEVKIFAVATCAAAALLRAGAAEFAEKAARYARLLMACQESGSPDWEKPLTGFYYTDRTHTIPWHHAHLSYEQFTTSGFEMLLSLLPDHADAGLWRAAMERTAEYYETVAAYTKPYGLLPEGVYFAYEAEKYPDASFKNIIRSDPECLKDFRRQVESGICLDKDKQVWLRVFPVWFSFRGNCNVQLSEAICAASAARVTGNLRLHEIAVEQMEWLVGKNPFGQSLIYGEGYDWTDEYTVQPGTTVGQMPVGIQTYLNDDKPWWPQVATATYKEVWIASAIKWMWLAAYTVLPARVRGVCSGKEILFTEKRTGRIFRADASEISGEFALELPGGEYTVNDGTSSSCLTVLDGESYILRLR